MTSALEIALAQPAIDPAHLQMLLAERLERTPLAAPALELSLRCDALVPGEAPNAELFPTRASERAGLTRLVERLQARLGREQVRCLLPVAEHRPERATQSSPVDAASLGPSSGAARSRLDAAWPWPRAVRPSLGVLRSQPGAAGVPPGAAPWPIPQVTRPVWLWPEPQPLHERGARPLLDGRPLQLLAGPERIESGWWDGALAARDYFIADAGDGALVWISRARLPLAGDEGWFLHGRFA